MATILFRNGWTLENHPQSKVVTMIIRETVIAELAALVADWRQVSDGKPLTEIKASVGLLLGDFADILGMTTEESERLINQK